jgi:hypothetical protein
MTTGSLPTAVLRRSGALDGGHICKVDVESSRATILSRITRLRRRNKEFHIASSSKSRGAKLANKQVALSREVHGLGRFKHRCRDRRTSPMALCVEEK